MIKYASLYDEIMGAGVLESLSLFVSALIITVPEWVRFSVDVTPVALHNQRLQIDE